MDRRLILDRRGLVTNVSGAAAASLLLAASTSKSFAQTMSGGTSDTGYEKDTLMWGTLSKQTSMLALRQAMLPKIREFAQFEIAEQTTIAQTLTNMNNPPPAPLSPDQQAQLQKLQASTGKAFDAAYIQGQIMGHQKLLQIQQAFLSGAPTDMDHKHIAMLAQTVINMHLTMLHDINSMIVAA